MGRDHKPSRRKFIKELAQGSLVAGAVPMVLTRRPGRAEVMLARDGDADRSRSVSPNDVVRLGVIGTGIIAHYNVRSALTVPGVELAAACDLYDGRLTRAKEVFGQNVFTTRDYRELLSRDDIDAVLVATPDHWHDIISIDAMRAGKAVYCEKPMVQEVPEGHRVIEAEQQTGAKFQVGSQGVSSIYTRSAYF